MQGATAQHAYVHSNCHQRRHYKLKREQVPPIMQTKLLHVDWPQHALLDCTLAVLKCSI